MLSIYVAAGTGVYPVENGNKTSRIPVDSSRIHLEFIWKSRRFHLDFTMEPILFSGSRL